MHPKETVVNRFHIIAKNMIHIYLCKDRILAPLEEDFAIIFSWRGGAEV